MKLLTKTNLNFLSISLFIFLFGIFAFYYLLRQEVYNNVNLELSKRKTAIIHQFDSSIFTARVPERISEQVIISQIDKNAHISQGYSDTLIFNKIEKRHKVYRQLQFTTTYKGRNYHLRIFRSLEESDDLIVKIFLMMTILIFIIIILLLLLNRRSTLRAWNVFYDTIDKIKKYNLDSHEQFSLKKSDVKEFDELNKVLLAMTEKIKTDYINLKEYTENASHEIQTPLAIINAKMEILLQSGDLKEAQLKAVSDAYEASNRLSKLNNSLILLSKIENRQFPESKQVEPRHLIEVQLEILEDLILSKNISIVKNFSEPLTIMMNPYLAEIMLSNLIKNAIRHNVVGGKLIIDFYKEQIVISNTGLKNKIDKDILFKRFHKSSSSSDSLGLGLAIVLKICEVYGFSVEYDYKNEMHCMKVNLKKNI